MNAKEAAFLVLAMAAAQSFAQFGPARVPAKAPAGPKIAEADIPYTNNVAANPGFEQKLVEDQKKGWFFSGTKDVEAKCVAFPPNSSEKPFEGNKAFQMVVKKPPKYSGKELNGSWEAFLKAEQAKGILRQMVPVKAGKRYAIRFRWKSSGLCADDPRPGPERGGASLSVTFAWRDKDGKAITEESDLLALNSSRLVARSDPDGWATYALPAIPSAADIAAKKKKPPVFATPPKGATHLLVVATLNSHKAKVRPEFWLDQFEVAEQADVPAAGN